MVNKNILIVGVGGQGTLLASRVLGSLAAKLGADVKLSEVHGMAQRGGSVVTHVKFGDKVYSPLVSRGDADIILAFESLEALRWCDYLKSDGTMVVNDQKIAPMPVITGDREYPVDIYEQIRQRVGNLIIIDALSKAVECGSAKAANTVLLGVLAAGMDIDKDIWLECLEETVPPKTVDINKRAFNVGYKML
jgi:indolepyruvate ferredoxin oxidoreductase beta subunit